MTYFPLFWKNARDFVITEEDWREKYDFFLLQDAEIDMFLKNNGKKKEIGEVLLLIIYRRKKYVLDHTEKWRYFPVFFHA